MTVSTFVQLSKGKPFKSEYYGNWTYKIDVFDGTPVVVGFFSGHIEEELTEDNLDFWLESYMNRYGK